MTVPLPMLTTNHLMSSQDVRCVSSKALFSEIVRYPLNGKLLQSQLYGIDVAVQISHDDCKSVGAKRATSQLSRVTGDLEDFQFLGIESNPVRLPPTGQINAKPLRRDCDAILQSCKPHIARSNRSEFRNPTRHPLSVRILFLNLQPDMRTGSVQFVTEDLLDTEVFCMSLDPSGYYR